MDIEISVTQKQTEGEGYNTVESAILQRTRSAKQVELLNLSTQIVAPLEHSVVLGVTPTPQETLAFVIKVESNE